MAREGTWQRIVRHLQWGKQEALLQVRQGGAPGHQLQGWGSFTGWESPFPLEVGRRAGFIEIRWARNRLGDTLSHFSRYATMNCPQIKVPLMFTNMDFPVKKNVVSA